MHVVSISDTIFCMYRCIYVSLHVGMRVVCHVCLNMKTLLGFRYRNGFVKSYIPSKKKQKTHDDIRVRTRNEFIGFVISLKLITNIYVNECRLIEFTVLGRFQSLLF